MRSFFILSFISLFFNGYGQFAPEQVLVNGKIISPQAPTSADLNGDGFKDVIISSDYNLDRRIYWYRNQNGSLNFEMPRFIGNTNSQSFQLIGADVDGDGDTDIISANEDFVLDGNQIVWFENLTGTGIFSSQKIIANAPEDLRQIAIGDIDNDGDIDIIAASNEANVIGWYKNTDGLGNFGNQIVLNSLANDIPNGALEVLLNDLDIDGDLDIIFCSFSNNLAGWFENDGFGNFPDANIIGNLELPSDIVVGDIDNDNFPDIVLGSYNADQIVWYKNLGSSQGFSDSILVFPYSDARDLKIMDLDGDGDLDILASSNTFLDEIVWFENLDGLGMFGVEHKLVENSGVKQLFITDLDNDLDDDILVTLKTTNEFGFFENENNSTNFNFSLIDFGIHNDTYLAIGDINNDGLKDIISSSNHLIKHVQQDENILNFKHEIINSVTYDYQFFEPELANLDNDEALDLAYFYNFSNNGKFLQWAKNQDSLGTFNDFILLPLSNSVEDFEIGDIDNDGDKDILTLSSQIEWFENADNLGNFEKHLVTDTGDNGDMTLGDTDLDGDLDIVYINSEFSENTVHLYWLENLDGLGNFGVPELIGEHEAESPYVNLEIKLIDFNEDDRPDIVFSTGEGIYWYRNNNGTIPWLSELTILEYNIVNSFTSPDFYEMDIDFDNDLDLIFKEQNFIYWSENLNFSNNFGEREIITKTKASVFSFKLSDLSNDGDLDLILSSFNLENRTFVSFLENLQKDSKIHATVFYDQNQNGIQDTQEFGINYQNLFISPNNLELLPNDEGQYSFRAKIGENQVACQPTNGWTLTTDSIVIVAVDSFEIQEVIFGVTQTEFISEPQNNLTSAATRCGFNVPFWLSSYNNGTVPHSGWSMLEIDPLTNFISAEIMPDSISNNQYFWFFDNLNPTYSHKVKIILEMPSADFLGEFIELKGETAFFNTDGSVAASDVYDFSSQINCAYDPNDKLVEPNSPHFDNYTLFGDTLLYTIRFQNTGTDTAFTVRIEDYLNPKLDYSTFQAIAASHEFDVTLGENGKLTFQFDNIILPDSTTNEIESHGFVKYQIQPLADLEEGTVINNEANIYFDFNEPILTNSVLNIMVSEFPIFVQSENPSCFSIENGSISINNLFNNWQFDWASGETSEHLENLSSGTYEVTVLDEFGDFLADTTILLESPDSLYQSTIAYPNIENANNGSISIIAEGGIPPYNFQWDNPNLQNAQIQNLPAGIYPLAITDANNCIIEVSVLVEQYSLNSMISSPNCYDSEDGVIEILNPIDSLNFLWSNGTQEALIENLGNGSYTLSLSNENENLIFDTTYQLNAPPQLVLNISTSPEQGNNANGIASVGILGGVPPYNYQWNTTPVQTTQTIINLVAGFYTVTITDANGCTIEGSAEVDMISAIENLPENWKFTVSPNPTQDFVNINLAFDKNENWEIQVSDLNGKILKEYFAPKYGNQSANLKLEDLEAGLFFISLKVRDKQFLKRVIVTN